MGMLSNDIDLPSISKSTGKTRKTNIMMFLKPNKGKEFYRFRLLKFNFPEKNDRDYPFIERHIHDHWAMNEKGNKLPDDTVVCLTTKFVPYKGNRYVDCPMCKCANDAFTEWKSSGFKDPISRDKFNSMKRKSQYIIPVYVVNDPNDDPDSKYKNTGKLKCFMFTDKETYDAFKKVIEEEIIKAKLSAQNGHPYSIWNNKNAVDICIRMDEVPVTYHKGEANEYTYKAKKITKMMFTSKPYDINEITDESISKFEFDDQYYVTNTIEDIKAFYRKNYNTVNKNVPDEDIDMGDDLPVAETPKVESSDLTNPKPVDNSDIGIDSASLDDLISDDSTVTESDNKADTSLESDPDDVGLDMDESKLDDLIADAD